MNFARWMAMGVLVLGVGAGWLAVNPPRPSSMSARSAQIPRPVRGGEMAGAALERFTRLAPIVPDPPPDAAQAAPPPPDVAVTFRREITAVEQGASGRIAWILDPNGEHGRRAIRAGQVYRDGWRVASIADQEVVLRRRRETRNIQLFDLPAPPDTP